MTEAQNNNKKFLSEGEFHKFIIHKCVLAPDNTQQYVLKGPFSKKYLLPKEYYEQYGFEAGQEITCRIDKINCSGRIFLEPEHPIYKVGEIYEFNIDEICEELDKLNNLRKVINVRDLLGNLIKVYCESYVKVDNPKKISCKVERIKKGKMRLSLYSADIEKKILFEGRYYSFEIIGETTKNHKKIFVLKDISGEKHILEKEYYKNFDIKIGKKINCKAVKIMEDGTFLLEPEHPYYKEGNVYTFKFLRVESELDFYKNKRNVIILSNKYNEECRLITFSKTLLHSIPDKMECKLIKIRKGELMLSEVT